MQQFLNTTQMNHATFDKKRSYLLKQTREKAKVVKYLHRFHCPVGAGHVGNMEDISAQPYVLFTCIR
jgi:hypothetical protein